MVTRFFGHHGKRPHARNLFALFAFARWHHHHHHSRCSAVQCCSPPFVVNADMHCIDDVIAMQADSFGCNGTSISAEAASTTPGRHAAGRPLSRQTACWRSRHHRRDQFAFIFVCFKLTSSNLVCVCVCVLVSHLLIYDDVAPCLRRRFNVDMR